MRIKKEYIVLPALIVALGAYLLTRGTDRTQYRIPDLPAVSSGDITKIEIAKSGKQLVLERKDGQWAIGAGSLKADSQKVEAMLEHIAGLTLTALVSESKSYERYDLADDQKIHVKAYAAGEIKRELDVGKAAPSFRHTFVRISGDPAVYHARENIRTYFDQTTDSLRDKTVLSFDKADIREITLTRGEASAVFSKKQVSPEATASNPPPAGPVWQGSGDSPADDAAIDRMIGTLSGLKCTNFIDDRKKEDLGSPRYRIRLAGQKELTLSIFDKIKPEDTAYPAFSSEIEQPFLLSAPQAEGLMKDPDALIKKEDAKKEEAKKEEGKKEETK